MEERQQILARQNHIDLLECIAIFLVLVYHCKLYIPNIIDEPSKIQFINYLFNTILSPCVSLFFFANGYLLFNKPLNLKKHFMKTIKLIVLAGIWGFIIIFYQILLKKESFSLIKIAKAIWTWGGLLIPFWFIGALVCIYLFFPILKATFDNNKKVFHLFTIVCFTLTFGNIFLNELASVVLIKFLHINKAIQSFNFFNIFNPLFQEKSYTIVYFCIGGIAYGFKDRILAINKKARNLFCILLIIISCFCLWGTGIFYSNAFGTTWDVVWNGYNTIFTFINVICIYILCLNYNGQNKIIRTISCNTLGIYFVHGITIESIKVFYLFPDHLKNIPCTIVFATIVLAISLAITLIIKKIPLMKKLVE